MRRQPEVATEELRLKQLFRREGFNFNAVKISDVPLGTYITKLSPEGLKTLVNKLEERVREGGVTEANINATISEIASGVQEQPLAAAQSSTPQVRPAAAQAASKEVFEHPLQEGYEAPSKQAPEESDSQKVERLKQQVQRGIMALTKAISGAVTNFERWKDTAPWFGGGEFKQFDASKHKIITAGKVQAGISRLNDIAINTLPGNNYPEQRDLLVKYIETAKQQTQANIVGEKQKLDPKVKEFFEKIASFEKYLADVPQGDTSKQIIHLEKRVEFLQKAAQEINPLSPEGRAQARPG